MSKDKMVRYVAEPSVRLAMFSAMYGDTSWETLEDAMCDIDGDDRNVIYRVTVEDVTPEPEQPRWWKWTGLTEQWEEHGTLSGQNCIGGVDPRTKDGMSFAVAFVYGTKADRDAKRDALIDAARKAGKP